MTCMHPLNGFKWPQVLDISALKKVATTTVYRDRDTTVNTWFGRVYPGGQVAQLVEHSPRMREVRGSSPRLAKDFFHERSWLSGLFVLCSYVPGVLVYDACFFLHFQNLIIKKCE